MKPIELIARGLIVRNDKILLCKSVEHDYYFLPGGHIEFGESTETALIREMQEETGTGISSLKFVGIFQNMFTQDGELHHEVNMLYSAKINTEHIVSQENHIDFTWANVNTLSSMKFIPKEFAEKIMAWHQDREALYFSTL